MILLLLLIMIVITIIMINAGEDGRPREELREEAQGTPATHNLPTNIAPYY